MRRTTTRLVSGLGAVLVVVLGTALPAQADWGGGSQTGDGYSAGVVHISYSGDAAPGDGGGGGASVPATCWWSPKTDVPSTTDPVAVKAWWEKTMPTLNGTFSFARVSYGDAKMYDDAIAAAAAGASFQYYWATCRDDAAGCPMEAFVQHVQPTSDLYHSKECTGLSVQAAFYPVGNPPAPYVDPYAVAQQAQRDMVLLDPEVDRNPKVSAVDGATLVGLPTWFWVTDAASVGGASGTRTIRADVPGTGVYAVVTARTGGLQITSQHGSTQDASGALRSCTPAQALETAKGSCTVTFEHASVGLPHGFPVTASLVWDATWHGTGQAADVAIGAPAARSATVDVPVAESQAVNTAG